MNKMTDELVKNIQGFSNFWTDLEQVFKNAPNPPVMYNYKNIAIEVKDSGDFYQVDAELPGFKKEDIKVMLDNNILTISVENKKETQSEDNKIIHTERYYGHYLKSISLPERVDTEKVSAKYQDGLLVLNIPKKNIDTKKTITID